MRFFAKKFSAPGAPLSRLFWREAPDCAGNGSARRDNDRRIPGDAHPRQARDAADSEAVRQPAPPRYRPLTASAGYRQHRRADGGALRPAASFRRHPLTASASGRRRLPGGAHPRRRPLTASAFPATPTHGGRRRPAASPRRHPLTASASGRRRLPGAAHSQQARDAADSEAARQAAHPRRRPLTASAGGRRRIPPTPAAAAPEPAIFGAKTAAAGPRRGGLTAGLPQKTTMQKNRLHKPKRGVYTWLSFPFHDPPGENHPHDD